MKKRGKNALVLFFSKTGHTKRAAEEVAAGLESAGISATVKGFADTDPEEVKGFSVVAVGSPTHGGKPARKVRGFMKGLPKKSLKGKRVAAFTSYGGARGNHTIKVFKKMLKKKGAKHIVPGVAVKAGAPLSLWKGPDIGEEDLGKLEALGKALAGK